MRLILHIGTAKTGTTALQSALDTNGRLLAKHRVIYPSPPPSRMNHNFLTAQLVPMDQMQREFTTGGDQSHDSLVADSAAYWRGLQDQVRRSDAEIAVLSGEYFYGLRPDAVGALQALLAEIWSDISVVAYVRDPAGYYVSSMQQRVKASHEIRTAEKFRLRAKVCLSRYLEAFDGNVTVRSAERAALVDGDVVQDFLASFVPESEKWRSKIDTAQLNESMSAEAMCIMQRLRRHGWPDQNGHFDASSHRVWRLLQEHAEARPQTRAKLRPEIHARFVQGHRPDLEFLDDQFGIRFDGTDALMDVDVGEVAPKGWTSGDLGDVLDVDREDVDRVLFTLLKELATPRKRRSIGR